MQRSDKTGIGFGARVQSKEEREASEVLPGSSRKT